MPNTAGNEETFKTLLIRELVLEPRLAEEFELTELLQAPSPQAEESAQPVAKSLDQGASITELGLEKPLKKELKRKRLFSFTKPMAEQIESVDEKTERYQLYCQLAACDGVGRAPARASRLLEEAATIEDSWARHHHLSGLIQGLRKNYEQAQDELEEAMDKEPFRNGKVRIGQALKHCEKLLHDRQIN